MTDQYKCTTAATAPRQELFLKLERRSVTRDNWDMTGDMTTGLRRSLKYSFYCPTISQLWSTVSLLLASLNSSQVWVFASATNRAETRLACQYSPSTRWWLVDSSAPLFIWVSYGRRSDDTTTVSIVDLHLGVSWCNVHRWKPVWLNIVFIMDILWLARKSKNKTPLGFRSGRPFPHYCTPLGSFPMCKDCFFLLYSNSIFKSLWM